jgi:quaternary ammonium compound-resistance protein SugE
MSWLYLFCAGLLEMGWPVGLKLAQQPGSRWLGILVAVGFMVGSGICMWLAQKTIPMGTAYAVWTGLGAAGTFLIGVFYFGDVSSLGKYLGVMMIIGGVAVLKLAD